MNLAAAVLGLVSHLCYFKRGEHQLYGARYIVTSLFLFVAALCFVGFKDLSLSSRLNRGNAHRSVLKLHEKYGEFVRLGSSTVSITHPKAIDAIYGSSSPCRKGDWYDITLPRMSMHMTRDPKFHQRRRRFWSGAFSEFSLRSYEAKVKAHCDRLCSRIIASDAIPINATDLFSYYTFDVMGDIGFGKSFDMLTSDVHHWVIRTLKKGFEEHKYLLPTWMLRLIRAIPSVADDYWRFVQVTRQTLHERIKVEPSIPDIMSALLEPWINKKIGDDDLRLLYGDAQLVIVAGTATTASTLTHLFYELVSNPNQLDKLRDELTPYFDSECNGLNIQKLQGLEQLNAVINETLRLYPSLPTRLQRLTPPEGIEIGETYIPGNITVWCPQYAVGRSSGTYAEPDRFIPERWTSRPDMIYDRDAFVPFSKGVYGCIGKPLAMLSIYTAVAKLIMNFDIRFAPGEGEIFSETTKDCFTLIPGKLGLVFTKREL